MGAAVQSTRGARRGPKSATRHSGLLCRVWYALPRKLRVLATATAASIALPLGALLVAAALSPLPPELLESPSASIRILSRRGDLLREVRATDGTRAQPLPLAAFPRSVRVAVLAAEDRRFYSHPGVDVWAAARAVASNIRYRRIVSGASTLTMQLARTLRPRPRTFWGKFREAALALRIEASLSKDRILEEYLNRVTYGPNLRGYAAASRAYAGKPPESLSIAEAALIAGLPRGPSLYALHRNPRLAKRRRDRVLARMLHKKLLTQGQCLQAQSEPLPEVAQHSAFGAPHFVTALLTGGLASGDHSLPAALPERSGLFEVRTSIDPRLQRVAEQAVWSTVNRLRPQNVSAAAVVAISNDTGEILAYVGSPDFFDARGLGQNDGVRALRQPGSTLKPFVYAEAIESLGFTLATVVPDIELHIPLPGGGDYTPHDYDNKYRGPVRLREALGNSLNVPAVYTLYQLGTARVLDRLHSVGFDSLRQPAEYYGPALALGDGEVTLLELANAYATLARGGIFLPIRAATARTRATGETTEIPQAPAQRVMDERVAWLLTDALADKDARIAAFGPGNVLEFDVPVAAKTGTSRDYRDNWAVGFTRDVTVAAWAGNFDGSPMSGVGGIAGAGPIFHAVMEAAIADHTPPALLIPSDGQRLGFRRVPVCALSGQVPTTACPHRVLEWLPEGDEDHGSACTVHQRLRIDTENGLLAGPDCERGSTIEAVFERFDTMYDTWAVHAGRSLPPRAGSPRCPPSSADQAVAESADSVTGPHIVYPFDGARFVVDPERPPSLQLLTVKAAGGDPGSGIGIRIDGLPLAHARRAVSTDWPLTVGEHTIVATSGTVESTPVHISVR